MQTSATGGIQGTQGQQTTTGKDAYDSLDVSQFIKLLVTEMQNQDPLNPMDNSKILEQISQIKAIATNNKLNQSLDSLQLQQNVSAANGMLDRVISGLTDKSAWITGKVDKVSIADGAIKLHIGQETVSMKNVSEIQPEGTPIVPPTGN
jgi:flagellar basal-body rod modification protein FlgD